MKYFVNLKGKAITYSIVLSFFKVNILWTEKVLAKISY